MFPSGPLLISLFVPTPETSNLPSTLGLALAGAAAKAAIPRTPQTATMARVLNLLGPVYVGAELLIGREFPIRLPISTPRGVDRATPARLGSVSAGPTCRSTSP